MTASVGVGVGSIVGVAVGTGVGYGERLPMSNNITLTKIISKDTLKTESIEIGCLYLTKKGFCRITNIPYPHLHPISS